MNPVEVFVDSTGEIGPVGAVYVRDEHGNITMRRL
jgi:hypothetical protein